MKSGAPTLRKPPVFYQILGYLADHPQAQDTVEGIVEWWLLEQRIKRATLQVEAALTQLVMEGLVSARQGTTGRTYYRVNQQKLRDIQKLMRTSDNEENT